MKLITDLDMPTVRYPGGNFISSFNWEDSIGPIEDRLMMKTIKFTLNVN